MISRRDFSAIRIGMMALSFCAVGALAQESPAPPPSSRPPARPSPKEVADDVENINSGDIHDFDPSKSCIVAVRPG